MPVREKPKTAEFFNFEDETLRVIGNEYSIAGLDEFYPLLLDGDTCTLLETRSETSRKMIIGSTNFQERYFLKQIPWYCDTVDRLTFSHDYQTQLYDLGLPVPRIFRTGHGLSWVETGNAKFALFAFTPGQRYNGSVEHTRAAAATLAKLHTAQFVNLSPIGRENIFSLVRDHVTLLEDHYKNRNSSPSVIKHLLDRVDNLTTLAMKNGWGTLKAEPLHGDFSPWNVLFNDDASVAAVLDFDNCDFDPVLHDVAEGIITFCAMPYRADSTNFASGGPEKWDSERVTLFLQEYSTTRPLSVIERTCLPQMIELVLIEFLCLGLVRGDYDDSVINKYIEFLGEPISGLS